MLKLKDVFIQLQKPEIIKEFQNNIFFYGLY